jgi:pimeloyl-ACP methyl ester carboxylesterase
MEGYLVLHGKKSGPTFDRCALHPIVGQLSKHSLVDFASHAWSYDRLYDQPFESCIESIKQARQRLIDRGADRIHILGHSLGGNAEIYYATRYSDFDSLILLAPAHNTHLQKIRAQCNWSLRKAEEYLAQGNDTPQHFVDFDSADVTVSVVRPSVYISYFNPNGPCNMTYNARKLLAPVNVLCLSGSRDVTQTTTEELVYRPMLKTAASEFHFLDEDHFTVCYNTHDLIVNWVNRLS